MGKLTAFNIVFNGIDKAIFSPGQLINGSIMIKLSAPMSIRAVKITFVGKCFVRWTEGSGNSQRTYSAKEYYFNDSLSLYGKGSGNQENVSKLQAGETMLPFTFILPPRLPSSFEGKFGHVRYYIKATIDKPMRFDENTKVAFMVLAPLNLNLEAISKLPVTKNGSKTLCCWCCKSGPIQAEFHLDRTGYVPGEFILINGSVENMSSKNMSSTKAVLVQAITYRTKRKSITQSKDIAKVIGPGCKAGSSITWNNERLQIPPVAPSELRFCNIINILYSIKFVVVAPAGSFNLNVIAPVLIGTIPLEGLTPYALPPVGNPSTEPTASTMPAPPMHAPSVVTPPMPGPSMIAPPMPSVATPPTAFQSPPPSYAASVGGAVNIKDEDDNDHLMGNNTFTPQYTYYDWSKSAFTYTNK